MERWRIALEKLFKHSYTHCVRHLGASCAGLVGRLCTHRHRQVTVNDAELEDESQCIKIAPTHFMSPSMLHENCSF